MTEELLSLLAWLLPRLGVALPVALVLGFVGYRWGVPVVVWRLYRRHLPTHAFEKPRVDKGAGSEDFVYYLSVYDVGEGALQIEGSAPESDYWMLGLNDCRLRAVERGHLNGEEIEVDSEGRFSVRVSTEPGPEHRTLDASGAPRGLIFYRVLLPDGDVEPPEVTRAAESSPSE